MRNRYFLETGRRMAAAALAAGLALQPAAALAETGEETVTEAVTEAETGNEASSEAQSGLVTLAIAGREETEAAETEAGETEAAETEAAETEAAETEAAEAETAEPEVLEDEIPEDWSLALKLTGAVAGDETADDLNALLEQGNIQLLMGRRDTARLLNIIVQGYGTDLFRLFGSVDEEQIRFALPDVSEDVYAAELASLFGGLAVSSASPIRIDGLKLPEDVDPVEELERLADVVTPYLEQAASLLDASTQVEENVEIRLYDLDMELTGSQLIVEPSLAQISTLLDTWADMISEDEALAELTEDWADILEEMYDLQYTEDTPGYETLTEGEETGASADQISYAGEAAGENAEEGLTREDIDAVRNFTQTAPDALHEAAESLEGDGSGNAFTFSAAEAEGSLVQMKFAVDQGNDEEEYHTDEPVLNLLYENYDGRYSVRASDGTDAAQLTGTYDVTDDRTQGAAELTVNQEPALTLTYDFDRTQYSALGVPYGNVILQMGFCTVEFAAGAGTDGSDDHTLMVSLSDMTEGISAAAVRLNSSTDTAPEEPAGTEVNIGAYDEEELSSLMASLAAGTVMTFMSRLGAALGS